jgi:YVTN family beta-propeller protein
MRFQLLGGLAVWDDDGNPLPVVGPLRRGLLAILLLHADEVLTPDRLIDELWGERAPPTAAKSLQVHVWRLRTALGGTGSGNPLATEAGGYVLRIKPGELDVELFERLLGESRVALRDGRPDVASVTLTKALALWHGPLLAEFGDQPFARDAGLRFEELRLEAVEARIDSDLLLGRHQAVIAELEVLAAANPLREGLRAQLMLALYRSGRQAEALAVYRDTRTLFDHELGLEPGTELAALERAVLAHDPGLKLANISRAEPQEAVGPREPEVEPAVKSTARPPPKPRARASRGGVLIAAGGTILLAALAAIAVELSLAHPASVEVAPNSVAAIDVRSNKVVAAAPAGIRPGAITVGFGSLWVANVDDQTVSRIDLRSLRTLHNVPVGGVPTGIAASSDAIWVAASDSGASAVSVRRVEPEFDNPGPPVRIGNVVPGGPGAVAARGNSIWAAPSSGVLTRLDPTTARIVHQVNPNGGPSAVALGDGAVWVSDDEANNVTRIDPTGLLTPIPVGNGPVGVAVGEGGVWVTDSLDDTVTRIDPSARAVTATISVGHSPAGVAVGAGSVWVANSGDGTVTRIDPRTNKPLAMIPVGGSPQAIAIANGRAWVTVDAQTIRDSRRPAGNETFRMDVPIDVDAMDPAQVQYGLARTVLYATCAKLLNYPDRPGLAGAELTPEVAQSLPSRSRDGRTYTFRIRKGFRFSPPSGEPVTARTFKATIERTLNPRVRSPLAPGFADIAGAQAYMTRAASHLSGVVVHGNTLTIHLRAPEPDFPSLVAEPALCAVPPDTPVAPPNGRVIPSAGPYFVSSYAPRQGVVLLRNPNYHGNRPHQLARIELSPGISSQRAVADIEAGTADYTFLSGSPATAIRSLASRLSARYGPGSPAAAAGSQQYFPGVGAAQGSDFLDLNTHRPLFAGARLRRAVNYAIDRRALARLGDGFIPLPERVTDQYLPPGIPGATNAHSYPLTPDLDKARPLTHGRSKTAVLYTCNYPTCDQQAQIIRDDLAPIGIHVNVKKFGWLTLFERVGRAGEPFDLATVGWSADYPDPAAMLTPIFQQGPPYFPTLDDSAYRRRLADTARLTGPRRYLAYGRLALDLARHAAPLVVFGNVGGHDFFSARIGCQTYGVFGLDLAALCIRSRTH